MKLSIMTWFRFSQPFYRLCAAFLGLLVVSIFLTDKRSHHAPVMDGNLLDYFTETRGDGCRLWWSNAVNSKNHLEEALKSKSHMIAGDVSISHDGTLIMAHPPSTDSDITLLEWLTAVLKKGRKGIRLTISTVSVIESTLTYLKQYESQIKVPLVLDAEILPGPGNPLTTPVDAHTFLTRCKTHFPNTILSLGWTTYVDSSIVDPVYDETMINEMKSALAEAGITQPITFSVRACIAKNSVARLQDLVRTFPGSTLTVWSRPADPVTVKDVLKFRSAFSLKILYFILPSPLKEEFLDGIANA